ncbi:MAG: Gfo/Idh/MocA family oxidoreductase [Chloroflexota bacterium]
MTTRVRFGLIGLGMMGRELASAVARWVHLLDPGTSPEIVAVCDPDPARRAWFEGRIVAADSIYEDHRQLLERTDIDVVYVAVPHHLHERVYVDVLDAGKHLFGEKPFGIDAAANRAIVDAAARHPDLLVRSSSEFPFYPGARRVVDAALSGRLGRIFEVRAGLSHSSDLDPRKPINWKRVAALNGEYGCMGDLGLHVLHIPMRLGWDVASVYAQLTNLVPVRPDIHGDPTPSDTWDNAILACWSTQGFPMLFEMKRIAPGEGNTWWIEVHGDRGSVRFSTKHPKQVWSLAFEPGGPQSWQVTDIGYEGAYPAITAAIFEFGFGDAVQQMLAAFCDELVHGERMRGDMRCATLAETTRHHAILSAALRSERSGRAEPPGHDASP